MPSLIAAARERVARLPRDTRDTLFQLAVIGWTVGPHLLHMGAWAPPMVVGLLAWRAVLAWRGSALPGRWLITALLLLAAALTLWTERTLLGREAGITLLVVLMSLKTLELRARRDALVVFFLGFFLVLTQFLYSQSLATGLWLLVAVWGLLTATVLAHMPVGRPALARAGVLAARTAALGLPVMVVVFALFPRIGPLWGLPQDAAGRTGLSGTLHLGGVASLAEDDSIALRVRFVGPAPGPGELYFRGPVLARFDGQEWTRLRSGAAVPGWPRPELRLDGPRLRYEMTLEPSRLPLLPLLEMTPDRSDAAPQADGWRFSLRADAQWQTDRLVTERLRVMATAWPQAGHGPLASAPELREMLALPPGSNPRTKAWAEALRQQQQLADANAVTLASAVLQHIRSGDYFYTLEPGPYSGDAIDAFWFDRRLGFCEHFASAFVVIMRGMGVPARLVTGYQGADGEPQDGWWIVRQRNAHAWAEIWQAGRGWVRVDPTSAVAPDRVRRGRSLQPPPGLVATAMAAIDPALVDRLRNAWEGLNNRWNQWVLNYSRRQQYDLLRALGVGAPDWQDLATTLIAVLCTASLVGAGWAWRDHRRQDPWQRLQQRIAQRLATLGVTVLPHHAPRTRAAHVRQKLGARGEALAAQLEALDHQRYGCDAASPPGSWAGGRRWWPGFAEAARAASAADHEAPSR